MWRKGTNKCNNLILVTQDVPRHICEISAGCEWRNKNEANVFKVNVDRNRKTMKGPQFRLTGNSVPSPKLSSERLGEEGA